MADATAGRTARGRRFASPRARALARGLEIALDGLPGSGPQGRVQARDLAAVAGQRPAAAPERGPGAAPPARPTRFRDQPLGIGRMLIARRLGEAARELPQFEITRECCMDALLAVRERCAARATAQGLRLTLNDFVLHAAAQALREVPALNVSFLGPALRTFEQVHLALAVAVEGGLVTPVIEDADTLGVARLSAAAARLVQAARAGALPAGATAGGTFTVSNLGGAGVDRFTALVAPPQAAILAVGAAQPRAVVRDGQLAVATMASFTLGCDHRAVDGALAARWLAAFHRRIEQPREEEVWN